MIRWGLIRFASDFVALVRPAKYAARAPRPPLVATVSATLTTASITSTATAATVSSTATTADIE